MHPLLWLVSGQDESELRAKAGRLHDFLTDTNGPSPADVGLSLSAHVAQPHRAAILGRDRLGLLTGLSALAADDRSPGLVRGVAGDCTSGAVFVFPGQGTQWPGMAVDLLASSPVFARRMAECDRALASYTDWSVLDVIHDLPGAPPLDRVDVVQPVLFAIMISLTAALRAYGVEPAAVIGHSQGEIAAACVAEILSLTDAARIVTLRSKLLAERGEPGGMISVVLEPDEVNELLAPWAGRLAIAAINGPKSVVVSGEVAALDEFERVLSTRSELRLRVPGVQFTAHSSQIDRLEEPLTRQLEPVRPKACGVDFFSTVECRWMRGPELDAKYWFRNLRDPVLFENATRKLVDHGHRIFVEVSAHPVLVPSLQETFATMAETPPKAVGSLRRNNGGPDRLLHAIAELHVNGVDIDWSATFDGQPARRVELPI